MKTLKREIQRRMPHVRKNPKVGRNDMCPCKSGRKFKNCCEKTFREQMQEVVIKRRRELNILKKETK